MNITELIAELAVIRRRVGDIQVAMPGGLIGKPIPVGGVNIHLDILSYIAVLQTRQEAKDLKIN